jgi:hypothetical protein
MSHIPVRVHAFILLLLAIGATICFALMIYHLAHFDIWSRSSEGAMAALLGILMYVTILEDIHQVILTDILS